MEKFFKLKENGTNIRTEIIAGFTTFFTMAYVIFVNPNILSLTGMDAGAVMVATCIAAAIGTLLTGLMSNYPFAQAPGMGLNAFFTFTICMGMGYSWSAALAAVFISGLIFIIVVVTGADKHIIAAIPIELKKAISAGIGLFIAYIGLKNAGWLQFTIDPGNYIMAGETVIANSTPIPAFNFASPTAILAIIGLVITAILMVKKVKGSLLLGIIISAVIGAIMQFAMGFDMGIFPPSGFSIPSLAPTFGAFASGFGELFTFSQGVGAGLISIVTVLISLTLVDMFDTIGTLVGTASKAGMLDKDGNLPRGGRAMLADAIATSVGAVLGTSTVTTYVESTAGVAEGGRTGLTNVVVAALFLLAIVASPLLGFITSAMTAPALIIVGVLMISGVRDIDWSNLEIAIPAFLTIACMPFAYSIADGIAAGFIFFVITKLVAGKAKEIKPIMYVLAALFLVRYILIMS